MIRTLIDSILTIACFLLFIKTGLAEKPVNLYELMPSDGFNLIESRKLFGDNLVNSFVIFIENDVPGHYHEFHSEHVLILAGRGLFRLGDEQFEVGPGDFMFIPKTIPHAFNAHPGEIVKVLSIQAPAFDGTDRIPYAY